MGERKEMRCCSKEYAKFGLGRAGEGSGGAESPALQSVVLEFFRSS
jgi:hypothetical protein